VILIAVLIDGYTVELQKSERYLFALEEQNKEIDAKNRLLEKKECWTYKGQRRNGTVEQAAE